MKNLELRGEHKVQQHYIRNKKVELIAEVGLLTGSHHSL